MEPLGAESELIQSQSSGLVVGLWVCLVLLAGIWEQASEADAHQCVLGSVFTTLPWEQGLGTGSLSV